jgi:tetratricopeptide (TPR) repeat protein
MAKKQPQKPAPKPVQKVGNNGPKPVEKKSLTGPAAAGTPFWQSPYFPGLLLFAISLIIAFITYKDYGVGWDEPGQRYPGILSYDYIFHGSQELFNTPNDNHGAGFELLLAVIEKWMNITDVRDIYFMRHLVTNICFLFSLFCAYVLIYRLFKNKFLASVGFLMLLLAPRIYAHSFFNSKDIPFMFMVTICLAYGQYAFEKNKTSAYLILGLLCGYATSIRIMGILLGGVLFFFLVLDLMTSYRNKEKPKKPLINIAVFSAGFVFLLYLGWPYLWKHPIEYFIESYTHLSHFDFRGSNLVNGKYEVASKLPWTYFPTWFLISNPEIWLLTGFAGMVWIIIDFFRKPMQFLRNTPERNFILYLVCFIAPIFAVIVLHSVIYDDWRHLYFVYPEFVLMAVYCIHKLYQTKYKMVIVSVCALEVAVTGFFMIGNHPYNQVYFNNLVSHAPEYLRKNYELDYWGCSYKQGMDYLLAKYPGKVIKIYCENRTLYDNNLMLLPEEERGRIQLTDPENADFFITNFRNHAYDYPAQAVEYSIKVLNSTILCIYRQEKDPVKQKQMRQENILNLNKALATNPDDAGVHASLGEAYLRNGQYDSAEFHHMAALKLDPASIIINDMAGEYFGKQQFRIAIDFCKKSLEINPNDVNPYNNMGLCYMRLAKFDSALYCYRTAVSIDPKFPSVYMNIAITYKAMGQLDSARKYEVIARQSNPGFKL